MFESCVCRVEAVKSPLIVPLPRAKESWEASFHRDGIPVFGGVEGGGDPSGGGMVLMIFGGWLSSSDEREEGAEGHF